MVFKLYFRVLVSGLSKRPGVRMLTLLIPAPTPDCRRLQLCCLSLIPSQSFLLPPLQLCRGQEAGLHRIHCLFLNFTGMDSFYICGHTKEQCSCIGIQASEHQSHIDYNCFVIRYRSKYFWRGSTVFTPPVTRGLAKRRCPAQVAMALAFTVANSSGAAFLRETRILHFTNRTVAVGV